MYMVPVGHFLCGCGYKTTGRITQVLDDYDAHRKVCPTGARVCTMRQWEVTVSAPVDPSVTVESGERRQVEVESIPGTAE